MAIFLWVIKKIVTFAQKMLMSTAELRKYRLTSRIEPSDELLATLMKKVSRTVKMRAQEANAKFFAELTTAVRQQRKNWKEQYSVK